MSITRVQSASGLGASGAGTCNFTNPLTGNLVVLCVVLGGVASPAISVPAGFIAATTQQNLSTDSASRIYYKINPAVGDQNLAVSMPGGVGRGVFTACEYLFSGLPALDVASSNLDGAGTTTHTTPTVNPLDGFEAALIAFYGGPDGSTTYSSEAFTGPNTGTDAELFDLDSAGTAATDVRGVMVERIDTNVQSGNYSCAGTSSASERTGNHIAIFRNATAHIASASLAGASALTLTGTRLAVASASLTGLAALTITGTRIAIASAALTGLAALTATAQKILYGIAALTGVSSVTSAGNILFSGLANLAGVSSISAIGVAMSIVQGRTVQVNSKRYRGTILLQGQLRNVSMTITRS